MPLVYYNAVVLSMLYQIKMSIGNFEICILPRNLFLSPPPRLQSYAIQFYVHRKKRDEEMKENSNAQQP